MALPSNAPIAATNGQLVSPGGGSHVPEVRCWPYCDITRRPARVRFVGQTGKHLLDLSLTGFDPKRSFASQSHLFRSAIVGATLCPKALK